MEIGFRGFCDSAVYRRRCDFGIFCTHDPNERVTNGRKRRIALLKALITASKSVLRQRFLKTIIDIDDVNLKLRIIVYKVIIYIEVKVRVIEVLVVGERCPLSNGFIGDVIESFELGLPKGILIDE